MFSCSERHVRSIGIKNVAVFRPVSLLIHDKNIYVTDRQSNKVWVLNIANDTVTAFGDNHVHKPEGITMDKAGFVYVTSDSSKIIVF